MEGGGAKGSFAFGCLLAFKERGIKFDAVAGTSVGALNALLWATDTVEQERSTWENLSEERVFLRRHNLPGIVLVAFHLYRSMLQRMRPMPELESKVFAAELLYVIGTVVSAVVFCTLAALSLDRFGAAGVVLIPIAYSVLYLSGLDVFNLDWRHPYIKLCVCIGAYVLALIGFLLSGSWPQLGMDLLIATPAGLILSFYGVYSIACKATLLDNLPLTRLVARAMSRGIKLPLYVTLAEEKEFFDPDRPVWHVTTGRSGKVGSLLPERDYFATYVAAHKVPGDEALKSIVASTALPLGLVEAVNVGGMAYVDGGVADNCPVYPLVFLEQCNEIIVIRLNPEGMSVEDAAHAFSDLDRKERLKQFRPPRTFWQSSVFQGTWSLSCPYRHNDPPQEIPFRQIAPDDLMLYTIHPAESLGGFVDGTMNFTEAYSQQNIRKGYESAVAFLDVLEESGWERRQCCN